MERCTICGSELPRNAQFCGTCGRLISTIREIPTSLMGYQTVDVDLPEEDGPTIITRPSNPGLQSGLHAEIAFLPSWSDKDTPTENLSPLADDEEEEKRRRAFFAGLPLPGGLTTGPGVPMVQGTPQFGGVPTVQGTPPLPGATSAAQGLQNAASLAPPPFSPLTAPVAPSTPVPNPGSWPHHPTVPTDSPPQGKPVSKGSGSKGKPGTGKPGNSGCGLMMLIVAAVIVILMSALGGLYFGLPPTISLVGSSVVTAGGVLHLHGNHFVPGSDITLTLDNSIPLFAVSKSANMAQRQVGNAHDTALSLSSLNERVSPPTPIRAGASGSFDVSIPVSTSWSVGKHSIRAAEVVSSRSTTLAFTIEATAPKLEVKPTTLDFGTLEVGSKAILSVVVNNSGQQSLNWQASAGGTSWLSLQPTSGTIQGNGAAEFIYVTGDASKLNIGTYKDTLHIHSDGGNTLVNVQLVVTPKSLKPTAKLIVTPTALDFGTLDSGTQLTRSVTIGNTGTAALNWTVDNGNANWVILNTVPQSVQPGAQPDTFKVTVDTSNLAAGTQNATLTINSNGGKAQVAITVVVNVPQQPCVLLTPSSTSLTFNTTMGSNPQAQSVSVSTTGNCSGGVTVTPTMASGSGWLAVTPSTAGISGGGTTFTVNVTSSALSPGSYSGSISLAAVSNGSAIGGSPQTVSVVLTVTEVPPVLSVSPSTLPISVTNGDSATSYTITVANTGGAGMKWNASLDANAPSFVTLSVGTNTTLAAGAKTTVTVNVNPHNQIAGTYSATVTVTAIDPITGNAVKNSPATTAVSITITANPPVLSVSPSTLPISVTNGDSATNYTITITNTGGSALQWNASLDANAPSFVTLTVGTNTTLAVGASATVTVNVNPYNQTAGSYAATVTVTAIDPITGNAVKNSPATTAVSITITAQPAMQLSTTSLTFTPATCVYTDSGTVSLTNSGGGTLTWNVGAPVYTTGSGWLTVTPSGSGSGNATLTFSANGTQLTAGQTYTATVTITPSVGNAQTVAVSFTVAVCIS